ncbi:Fic family protein [Alloscardovia macacae]|nr:Fic family protein [Alloscardovia macacae]
MKQDGGDSMTPRYEDIEELLRSRADIHARLNLLPYDGSPEIKDQGDGRYLYTRKRVAGKLTSTYVGAYSDTLYNLLLNNAREARSLRKELRRIEKELSQLGYTDSVLAPDVLQNRDFARANMAMNIYDQAVLEGVATSFPQTEDILNNGQVFGVTATDVQKILNLKHAWKFILDNDVLSSRTDYSILSRVAQLVNGGFFTQGGRIRGVPVTIGGSSYVPPLPYEGDVRDHIHEILSDTDSSESSPQNIITTAIRLCLYCMKTQIFLDGNKRAAVIFANHYLISHAGGYLVIPEACVPEFKTLLMRYYEGEDISVLMQFMTEKCWKRMAISHNQVE